MTEPDACLAEGTGKNISQGMGKAGDHILTVQIVSRIERAHWPTRMVMAPDINMVSGWPDNPDQACASAPHG